MLHKTKQNKIYVISRRTRAFLYTVLYERMCCQDQLKRNAIFFQKIKRALSNKNILRYNRSEAYI